MRSSATGTLLSKPINPETMINNTDCQAYLLLSLVRQDPRYSHLVEIAKSDSDTTLPPESKKVQSEILGMVIADPKDFYGTAKVTQELKKEAVNTATVNTMANWFDLVSNFSFWMFLFKSPVPFLDIILSLLASSSILTICNVAGKTASNRRQENLSLSNTALGVLIALNLVKSLFSGVGIELLLNQPALNQQMAQTLIEQQVEQIETLKKLDSPQYLNTVKRCDQGRAELETMPRQHPRWDSLYQELFGSWQDRERDWSDTPIEQVPICRRVDRLEQDAYAAYETAKATLNQKLIRRSEIGNDLVFLQEQMPQVYQAKFKDRGDVSTAEIASGTDAIGMATRNFFGKLRRGEWSDVSASLFGFSLSVITSAAAIFVTYQYARRQDVLDSRDEAIALRRDRWLESRWQEIVISSFPKEDEDN
ncbi:MAG: hypothetical protein EA365_10630 [Gloeocapsa sp. DLM2.Bin57]|nr:MAG: hypothetical protein EA365_10630 [Gloeocapsa sp. DLM2.Bin57]